jgi:predicted metal-dependent HD superfamily phosphohydrolase
MDYLNILKRQWCELTDSTNNLADEIFNTIVSFYTGANRYYHTISHIGNMIELANEYSDEIQNKKAFYFAIFYHDLIYDISRNDNEERSAEFASSDLQRLHIDNYILRDTTSFILATKCHDEHTSSDINMFIDMDLAILGSPKEQYEMYVKNIRKEYSCYNDLHYKKGRIDVLRHFTEMQYIFKTNFFRIRFEQNARSNINFELTTLK